MSTRSHRGSGLVPALVLALLFSVTLVVCAEVGKPAAANPAAAAAAPATTPPTNPTELPVLRIGDLSARVPEPEIGKPLPAAALAAPLRDQDDRPRSLAGEDGKVRVVSFFFRCCQEINACPKLTEAVTLAADRLSPEERAQVRVFLVSFDPARDTPDKLKEYGKSLRVDPTSLVLATGTPADVKTLTEACGVWFGPKDGTLDHNMRTVVLDRQGNVRKILRMATWEPEDLLAEIRRALKG